MTTREQIIAAAKEAGFDDSQWDAMTYDSGPYEVTMPGIELRRFYTIAFEAGRVAEREECARIIEAQDVDPSFKHRMADAIRTR